MGDNDRDPGALLCGAGGVVMDIRRLRGWLARLFNIFNRRRREREFAEELESHLAMHIEDNLRAAMSPEEARRQALIKLGGVTLTQELYREQGGLPMLETFWQDLRYGARMLRKIPVFTLIAVMTLALGIGANTAVFSVINAALLQPYTHIDTDRWVYLSEKNEAKGLQSAAVSIPNFMDWRRQNQSFSEMFFWSQLNFNLSGPGAVEPERVRVTLITENLFSALKLGPAAGRFVSPEDYKGNGRNAILSYGLWQRRFGADPNLPGRTITLNLRSFTVLGVAPPGFSFPVQSQTDIWVPNFWQDIEKDTYRSGRGYTAAAMLKPGVSLSAAQADMDVIAGRLASQYPEDKGFGVGIESMRESVAGGFRTPLLILLGALGFVLLLACVNIANLQLVRMEARRKELAVRSALGASARRLLSQMVTESLLLVAVAGVLGICLAPIGVKLLLWLVPPAQIPWLKVKADGVVLLVSFGATALTALLAGLAPAFKAARFDVISALGAARSTGAGVSRRWRVAFVIAQLALAVLPLSAAALLVNSFARLSRVEPGFQVDHRLTLSYFAPLLRYKDRATIAQLAERMGEELRRVPGIKAAGGVHYLPFSPALGWGQAVSREQAQGNPADLPHVIYTVATTGYMEALGFSLKSGRLFSPADSAASAPVVVINEALAKRHFPNENPIGKPLWIGHAQALPTAAPRTIIGVVGDTLLNSLDSSPNAAAWVPISQQDGGELIWRNLFLVAHTTGEPRAALAAIRKQIAGVDADLALADIATMEERLGDSLWRQRFTVSVLGAFSIIALAIAALGVFGVTSYLVGQRTHEIGVRVALGAMPGDIFRLALKEGIVSTLIGIAIGVAGSLALTRFLGNLLYGVSAKDPFTLAAAAILLALVALAACSIPARRATKVDPLIALRTE
jgi:putative ABC transport system permease protein